RLRQSAANHPCSDFNSNYAGRWRMEEEPLPLVEVYTVALLSYAQVSSCLSSQLRLSNLWRGLTCLLFSIILSLSELCVLQSAHSQLQENGITQLALLSAVAQETGVWTNSTLRSLLSNESPQTEEGEFSFTTIKEENPVHNRNNF
uniref:Zinc finger protein 292b n=1 Tax=Oncorhynchus mykiss TaxID=8022 RepID=A0A8L0DS00_ONCMY